mmetsp:Transcript_13275/g.33920  ORF Transcript_13275/g.33920 Transcript_13275/m.33920 type:complete len:1540 (-) Transcript_13275:461-5080(-)
MVNRAGRASNRVAPFVRSPIPEEDNDSGARSGPADPFVDEPEVLAIGPTASGEEEGADSHGIPVQPVLRGPDGVPRTRRRVTSVYANRQRSPAITKPFQEKWANVVNVLAAFHEFRTVGERKDWLRAQREARRAQTSSEDDVDDSDPSEIAAEFGMYFFEGIYDHEKHTLVERVDKVLDNISLLDSPGTIDPDFGADMAKDGGDFRYLSRAFEWRSFFNEARNWIAHDENFAPFDDELVLEERSRAIQLAQTMLYVRDHLGPVASWQAAAGEANNDYDLEVFKACTETEESVNTSSYHLLDFESEEGVTLFHLAASAGCPLLFYNFLRIGAALKPTLDHKERRARYFAHGPGSDDPFDTRGNRKLERLVRFLNHFADAATKEVHDLNVSKVGDETVCVKESKAFERALKAFRGHMDALELFTPHGNYETERPSAAARQVLDINDDGQLKAPSPTLWPKNSPVSGHLSHLEFTHVHTIRAERQERKSQVAKTLDKLAQRYADEVLDGNKRSMSKLRADFEEDALRRYQNRLELLSDAEHLFDDIIEKDMYGRTALHFAVQYDQRPFVEFVVDTESEKGLFHHLVFLPLVSPCNAYDEGVHVAFNLLGDEFKLELLTSDSDDGHTPCEWIPVHPINLHDTVAAVAGPQHLSAEERGEREILERNLKNRYLQKILLSTTTEGETPMHTAARYDRQGIIFVLLSAISSETVLFESEDPVPDEKRDSNAGASKASSPRVSANPIGSSDKDTSLPNNLKVATLKQKRRVPHVQRFRRPSRNFEEMKDFMPRQPSSHVDADGSSLATDATSWLQSDVSDECELHDVVAPFVLRDAVSDCCPCRSPKAFSDCCGRSNRDMWSQARAQVEGRQTVTPLIGRAMQLAPPESDGGKDYKSLLHRPLTLMQRIYRDMRDRNNMTALHIACKMDRDEAATVLLGLGSDPGTRDVDGTCAMYHMILNIPTVAEYALDQFRLVDRSNRTEALFLSFLMPQEPEDELILRKRQHDEDHERHQRHSKILSAANTVLKHHTKPSHREKPRWTWHPFTRDEYRYKYWAYARPGNVHSKTLHEVLGRHVEESIDKEQIIEPPRRERQQVLGLVVDMNRIGCANKLALTSLVQLHWKHFCKHEFRRSATLYFTFLGCWTFVAYAFVYGPRDTAESWYGSDFTLVRTVVEFIATIILMVYVYGEFTEFSSIVTFTQGARELETEDIYNEMAAMSETWPDYFYLWRQWDNLENSGGGWWKYLSDAWNQFDLIAYTLLFLSEVLTVVGYLFRDNDTAWWQVRILLVGIIFAYLKIFKLARSSKRVGPFVIMLGGMVRDCLLFLFLFVCTWIPFSLAFFVLFHNDEDPALHDSFGSFGRSLLSGFQMMMVDFDYSELRNHDETTGAILWMVWVFLSALVFLNLFIAMMSNTYQLVQDDSNRIAVMQRCITVVSMGRNRTAEERREQRLTILANIDENGCGRERYLSKYYDDPDDDGPDHERNLRLEILSGVNATRSAIARLDGDVSEGASKERKNRKLVKILARNVDNLAQRICDLETALQQQQ